MKTFKQFIAESEKKNPKYTPFIDKDGYGVGFATIGQHSIPKKTAAAKTLTPFIGTDGYGVGFATIGQHSIPKIKEEEQLPFRFMKKMGTSTKPAKEMPSKGLPSNTNRIHDFTPWHTHEWGDKGKKAHMATNVHPLHDALSKHFEHFDGHHLGGIRDYTDGSDGLNGGLINRHVHGFSISEEHHDTIHRLDSMFKEHKAPHDMTVYSGTSHSPEHYPINPDTGKRHMHFPAFTSTSINATTAGSFSKKDHNLPSDAEHREHHVIKFHLPKGHPAAYLENHTSISGEYEMLLHRGMKAHVDPHPQTVTHEDPYVGTKTTHIWTAHIQPHSGEVHPIVGEHPHHTEHAPKPVHHDIPELPGEHSEPHIDANKKLGITKDW